MHYLLAHTTTFTPISLKLVIPLVSSAFPISNGCTIFFSLTLLFSKTLTSSFSKLDNQKNLNAFYEIHGCQFHDITFNINMEHLWTSATVVFILSKMFVLFKLSSFEYFYSKFNLNLRYVILLYFTKDNPFENHGKRFLFH